MLHLAGSGIVHPEETLPVMGKGIVSAKEPRQSLHLLPASQ